MLKEKQNRMQLVCIVTFFIHQALINWEKVFVVDTSKSLLISCAISSQSENSQFEEGATHYNEGRNQVTVLVLVLLKRVTLVMSLGS